MSRDSVVDDWLPATSDVSVICRVVNPRQTSQRIWGGFLYRMYRPGNDFELILMVEMETINPVEGYLISEFPAICNHFSVIVIMAVPLQDLTSFI